MTGTYVEPAAGESRDKVVRFRVNATELAFLQRVALEDDRSVSSVLRLALKEFYEKRSREDVLS